MDITNLITAIVIEIGDKFIGIIRRGVISVRQTIFIVIPIKRQIIGERQTERFVRFRRLDREK